MSKSDKRFPPERFHSLVDREAAYRALPKEPLRVTLRLASPFAVTGHLPLDGLLHTLVKRDLGRSEFFKTHARLAGEGRDQFTHDVPLPLEESEAAGRRYYASSFGSWEGVESVTRWRKRWCEEHDDLADFGRKQEKVLIKLGRFRAYDMPLVIHAAPEVVFHVFGNGEEMERLLAAATYIGKKRSQGYGRVRQVLIELCAEDWSCWREGKPTRALPVDEVGQFQLDALAYTGYRPPYWWPPNQCLCLVP
jgi:hypothetical protein